MKRSTLLQHLRRHGCYLKRQGSSHSLWTNPRTGAVEAIPRHTEISNVLPGKFVVAFHPGNWGGVIPVYPWLKTDGETARLRARLRDCLRKRLDKTEEERWLCSIQT